MEPWRSFDDDDGPHHEERDQHDRDDAPVGPPARRRTEGIRLHTIWIGPHDLAIAGPPREVSLSEPETPPDQVRTIVEFPVVEVAAAVPVT